MCAKYHWYSACEGVTTTLLVDVDGATTTLLVVLRSMVVQTEPQLRSDIFGSSGFDDPKWARFGGR